MRLRVFRREANTQVLHPDEHAFSCFSTRDIYTGVSCVVLVFLEATLGTECQLHSCRTRCQLDSRMHHSRMHPCVRVGGWQKCQSLVTDYQLSTHRTILLFQIRVNLKRMHNILNAEVGPQTGKRPRTPLCVEP